jgi:hypothetical protein
MAKETILNGILQGGAGGASSTTWNDDVLIKLGTDGDGVALLRSAVLNADTTLTSVLIGGTPDTHALAANSLIIANATADGDILIAGNDGGTSRQFIYCDVSAGNIYLGGKDGTPGNATGVGDAYFPAKIEVDGNAYFDGNVESFTTVESPIFVTMDTTYNRTSKIRASLLDTNAMSLMINLNTASGMIVPSLSITGGILDLNLGLFDGITQPLFSILEKGNQLHTMTDGIANAGAATAILNHTGGFTNSVVGDIVRITAGTLCTTGWYWITTVTSADQVTLDRNYTSGDTTNVTCVVFHNFPMIGADGVCLKCFDGAPADANTEIDRDGWIQLDVGNNLLYGRSQTVWQHWTPDGGSPNFAAIDIDTTDITFNTSVDSAAVEDKVSLGAYEISAGHRALAISSEEVVAADVDETKFSHKLPVRINGATYNIMLCAT